MVAFLPLNTFWHLNLWKRGLYKLGSEVSSGVCSVSFRICVIAHHCTSHKISSAVLMHSQHNSDPNTAPYIDGRLALGCLIYNNAHSLPSLAKKTLNKTSTI